MPNRTTLAIKIWQNLPEIYKKKFLFVFFSGVQFFGLKTYELVLSALRVDIEGYEKKTEGRKFLLNRKSLKSL